MAEQKLQTQLVLQRSCVHIRCLINRTHTNILNHKRVVCLDTFTIPNEFWKKSEVVKGRIMRLRSHVTWYLFFCTGRWSFSHFHWPAVDVMSEDLVRFKWLMKIPDANRGRHWCSSGSVSNTRGYFIPAHWADCLIFIFILMHSWSQVMLHFKNHIKVWSEV